MSALSDKALAYWELDEAWNVAHADSTANAYDLYTGLTDPAGDTLSFCGKNATTFVGGSYNYLEKTVTVADLSPSGSFQMTGWFYKRSAGAGYLVSKRGNWVTDRADYALYSDGTNLRFDVADSTGTTTGSVTSSVALAGGAWYFWSVRHNNGTSIQITVGAAGGTLTTDEVVWTGGVWSRLTSTFRLGKSDDTSQGVLNGYMSRVGFWPILSDAEVDYLFGLGGACPPEWPFADAPDETQSGWLVSALRARSGTDLSAQVFGVETPIVFVNPVANYEYTSGEYMVDMDGVGPNDPLYWRARRYGGNSANTDTRRETLVTVDFKIPIRRQV